MKTVCSGVGFNEFQSRHLNTTGVIVDALSNDLATAQGILPLLQKTHSTVKRKVAVHIAYVGTGYRGDFFRLSSYGQRLAQLQFLPGKMLLPLSYYPNYATLSTLPALETRACLRQQHLFCRRRCECLDVDVEKGSGDFALCNAL